MEDPWPGRLGGGGITRWRGLVLVLVALVGLAGLAAAEPPEPRIRRISTDDGLVQSSALSMVQDRQGFLWIGTQDGLHRTNGYRFDVYKPDPFADGTLSHAMVQALAEGADGCLWVGTFRGLDRFDASRQRFEPMLDGETPHVTSLARSRDGGLWVGTLGEGLRWLSPVGEDGGRTIRVWRRTPGDPTGLPDDRIWALLEDGEGRLWVGTAAGLAWLHPGAEGFEIARHGPRDPDGLPGRAVYAFHRGRSGAVWVGTEGGLARWEPAGATAPTATAPTATAPTATAPTATAPTATAPSSTARFQVWRHDPDDPDSLAHDVVRALLEDREGTLWIGTGGGGLDALPAAGGRFLHHRHDPGDLGTLSHDQVWSLYEDQSGLLWVGTALGGVDVVDTHPKFRYERPSRGPGTSHVVRAILEDGAGDLWIGLDQGGVLRRRAGSGALVPFDAVPAERVWHLLEDPQQRLWVAMDAGLLRFDSERRRRRLWTHDPRRADSLGPGGVRRLLVTSDGSLWIGHFGGGLSRMAPGPEVDGTVFERFQFETGRPDSLSSNLIFDLLVDREGRLWIGTGEGLDRWVGEGRFEHFRNDPHDRTSLVGSMVRSLWESAEGTLWVGTDAGLSRLHEGPGGTHFEHLTEADGLPNHTIYAIAEDRQGHLWLSTNRGLTRLDPASRQMTHYDPSDGLQAWEFNGAAVFTARDGTMYFGGVRGYNVFHPSEVSPNPFVPPVVLTGLRQMGRRVVLARPLSTLGELDLAWDDSVFTLEFAALDFTDPPSNQYAYRLEGLHDDWIEIGSRNEATFTNLEAGRYVFQVRGSNADGVWNETGASLAIRVHPVPWLSLWALALYALVVGLLAGSLGWQVWRRQVLRREVAREQALWYFVFDSIAEGIFITDTQNAVEAVNGAFCTMTGYDEADVIGRPTTVLESPYHGPDFYAEIRQALAEEGRWRGELRQVRKDGSSFLAQLDLNQVLSSSGELSNFVGVFTDITESKRAEEELRNLANNDPLTGLPNRASFQRQLNVALEDARRGKGALALIFGDLDNFKDVNDSLGHGVGDKLLKETARRLLAAVRQGDLVARLGGDEFTVLLAPIDDEDDVRQVAERILTAFGAPFRLGGRSLNISTSLGISLYPRDAEHAETLLQHADSAMYDAKAAGRNRYCFYDADTDSHPRR